MSCYLSWIQKFFTCSVDLELSNAFYLSLYDFLLANLNIKQIYTWTRSKFWGTSFLNHWQLFQLNDKNKICQSFHLFFLWKILSLIWTLKMISSHGFGLYIVPLSVRKFHLLSTLATSNFLCTTIPLIEHFPPWSILDQPCLFYSSCYSHRTGLKVQL